MAEKDISDVAVEGTDSARGYVEATRKSWATLLWIWRELLSPQGRRKLRQMVGWAMVRNLLSLTVPYFLAQMTLFSDQGHFAQAEQAWVCLAAVMLLSYGARIMQDICIELGVTEMIVHLDFAFNKRFFDKSISQHRNKDNMLDAANIEKARGRSWETVWMVLWSGTEAAMQMAAAGAFLWIVFPFGGLSMSVTLFLFLVSMIFLNRKVLEVGAELDRTERLINMDRADLWQHARLVIWAHAAEREVERLLECAKALIKRIRALWVPYITIAGVRDMLVGVVCLAILRVALLRVASGALSAEALVPIGIWCFQFASALGQVRGLDRAVNWNTPTIRAARECLELPCDVPEHPDAVLVSPDPVTIEVQGLRHRYGDGKEVLKGVDVSIVAGEKVALVGLSGSGKSTFASLLMRAMDPTEGQITITGTPLDRLKLDSWRATAGYIPQDPSVLERSLRDNLLFTLPEAVAASWTDEALMEVLASVNLQDRFPDGLDTMLGKRGEDLSGGERQRLIVARALIKRPRFLIVDEATSSLDSESEAVVQMRINQMLEAGSSALIIAHRLATIDKVDRVIVLHKGVIIDQGTHEEVFARCELFRTLCKMQKLDYSKAA